MIGRRAVLTGTMLVIGAGAWSQPQRDRRKRVGFIGVERASTASWAAALWSQLAELGWRDGDTMTVFAHWVDADQARAEAAAADLVARGADVIFATNAFGVDAVRAASRSVPIVFAVHGDPIGAGHVASLPRPGGNVTGVAQMQPEIASKGLQVLLEAVPAARRVAVLLAPRFAPHRSAWPQLELTARELGIEALAIPVNNAEDIDPAFDRMRAEQAQALLVLNSPVLVTTRANEVATRAYEWLIVRALEARLPSMLGRREFAEAGGMLSFGSDFAEMHRRAAHHVDKILRGANPADLPVEQPSEFELVINLRTARALNVVMPQSLLARADEVIE
jgi:putative tryptophan/tyrosine transport system substrate-binding protein